MWARKQEYQYYIGQMMINCILKCFVIYQKGINKPLRIRCSMQISYCFIKSNVNSVLVLVGVSKVFFHNDSPFFDRVMSSSRNVWVVLRIQQICNTTRHKSPIYGFFKLQKRSQRDNYFTIQYVIRRFRKVCYTSEFRFRGVFSYSLLFNASF